MSGKRLALLVAMLLLLVFSLPVASQSGGYDLT
jgi:hypothetical protein